MGVSCSEQLVLGALSGHQGQFKLHNGTLINKPDELLAYVRSPGYLFMALISVGVWWYKKMLDLIDDTSVWSSDHSMGSAGGRLHWERGGSICSNTCSVGLQW